MFRRPPASAGLSLSLGLGDPADRACLSVILAGAAFLAVLVWRAAVSTPFEDEFYFGSLYRAALSGRAPPLNAVLLPHYGHIYILLNLALWAVVYFDLPLAALIWLQIPLLAGAALVLSRFMQREIGASLPVRIAALLLVLSPNQWEDLYWAMEVSVALLMFFTMLALERSACFVRTGEARYATQAMICGFLAACSQGAGIASAVLILPLLLTRIKAAPPWVPAGIYAAALAALYVGTHALLPRSGAPLGSADAWFALAQRLPAYWALYFGTAVFPAETFDASQLRISAGIAFVVCAAWVLWHTPRGLLVLRGESFLLTLGAVIAVTIGVARVSGGVYQPDASRYFPFVSVAWIGVLCLTSRTTRDSRWVRHLLVAMILFGYFAGADREFHTAPYRKLNLRDNQAALCQGRRDGLAFHGDMRRVDLEAVRLAFCRT